MVITPTPDAPVVNSCENFLPREACVRNITYETVLLFGRLILVMTRQSAFSAAHIVNFGLIDLLYQADSLSHLPTP